MSDEKAKLSLGEDDVAFLKKVGVAADEEDTWAVRMAVAMKRSKRVFANPRNGEIIESDK